ncbi:SRPBCC family protein [Burkholderia paludis]|uniref:hypothetical protein n=1 Tax=Burkholderia paludis TaxID=1506587 RepID=UPI00068DD549|nr:hypothetical protein [Burkholderia paludis]
MSSIDTPMDTRIDTVTRRSIVRASADSVWKRVTDPAGINDELFPILRMTVPASIRGKVIEEIPLGVPVCRSWFLLFGALPIDYDDITIARCEPGRQFREESTMFSMRSWTHERVLRDVPGGCEVTDTLTYRLRFPLRFKRWLIRGVLGYLFAHRHRRLAEWCERQPQQPQAVRER